MLLLLELLSGSYVPEGCQAPCLLRRILVKSAIMRAAQKALSNIELSEASTGNTLRALSL